MASNQCAQIQHKALMYSRVQTLKSSRQRAYITLTHRHSRLPSLHYLSAHSCASLFTRAYAHMRERRRRSHARTALPPNASTHTLMRLAVYTCGDGVVRCACLLLLSRALAAERGARGHSSSRMRFVSRAGSSERNAHAASRRWRFASALGGDGARRSAAAAPVAPRDLSHLLQQRARAGARSQMPVCR